jgi:hypothetical protein
VTQHWERMCRRGQEWQPPLMLLVVAPPKMWLEVSVPLYLPPASPLLWLAERQVGCLVPVPVFVAGFQTVVSLARAAAQVLLSVQLLEAASEAPSKASLMELQSVPWHPDLVMCSPRRLSSPETRVAVGQA